MIGAVLGEEREHRRTGFRRIAIVSADGEASLGLGDQCANDLRAQLDVVEGRPSGRVKQLRHGVEERIKGVRVHRGPFGKGEDPERSSRDFRRRHRGCVAKDVQCGLDEVGLTVVDRVLEDPNCDLAGLNVF